MLKNTKKKPGTAVVTGPRSLTRLLGIFDVLAKSKEPMSLAELNQALKSPKSSLLNLLRPLVNDGYLACESGRYRLGPSIFRIAANIMAVWNFSSTMRPYLIELSQRTGESVYMGVLDSVGSVITYVDAIESLQSVRFSVPVGAARPLFSTAAGRVLLAFGEPEWVDNYLRHTKLAAFTPFTISSRKALRDELEKIRKTRISISLGETFQESGAISAPIFGANGQLIAAIAIGAPVTRLEPRVPELRPIITEIASRASGSTRSMLRANEAADLAEVPVPATRRRRPVVR